MRHGTLIHLISVCFFIQRRLSVYSKMQECFEQQQQQQQIGGRGIQSRDQELRQGPTGLGAITGQRSTPESERKDSNQPAEAEYLGSRCVLFTYFQGEIGDVVDEHFSRALSQSNTFGHETKPIRVMQPSVSATAGQWKGELNYIKWKYLICFDSLFEIKSPIVWGQCVLKGFGDLFQIVGHSLRVRAAQCGIAPIHPRPALAFHPSQSTQTSHLALYPSIIQTGHCGPTTCSHKAASRLQRPSPIAGLTAWTHRAQVATPMSTASTILTFTVGTATQCFIHTQPTALHWIPDLILCCCPVLGTRTSQPPAVPHTMRGWRQKWTPAATAP